MQFILGLVGVAIALLIARKSQAQAAIPGKTAVPDSLQAAAQRTLKNSANWMLVSKMETAAWSSNAFVYANNPWGMQRAQVRPNHQNGTYQGASGGKLATYLDVEQSVLDLQDWINYTKFPEYEMSLPAHLEAMKARGYFVESLAEYLNMVNDWAKK